jgi:hypothetical protein
LPVPGKPNARIFVAADKNAPRLNEDVDHVPVLINGTPEIVLTTTNPNEDFVEVPDVAAPRPLPSCLACVLAAELLAALADGFVGDFHSSLRKQILNVSEAQREPVVEPNGVADDLGGESITSVAGRLAIHPRSLPITPLT